MLLGLIHVLYNILYNFGLFAAGTAQRPKLALGRSADAAACQLCQIQFDKARSPLAESKDQQRDADPMQRLELLLLLLLLLLPTLLAHRLLVWYGKRKRAREDT